MVSFSYNIIIHALCEMDPLDVALLVLRQLEGNGKQPDLVTFKTLLNAPYRNHRFSKDEKMGAMKRPRMLLRVIIQGCEECSVMVEKKRRAS